MNKVIILSIRPEWLAKILNGEKTIEIRKSIPRDLPIDVYLYCTKEKPYLIRQLIAPYKWFTCTGWPNHFEENGLVLCKFTLNKISFFDENLEELSAITNVPHGFPDGFLGTEAFINLAEKEGKLSRDDFNKYFGDELAKGYAWHIDDLVIFDKPMKLSGFYTTKSYRGKEPRMIMGKPITQYYVYEHNTIKRAPQSWCYAYLESGK